MAIDITEVVVGIVGQVVAQVNTLSETLAELEALNEFATDAGLDGAPETFTDYETAIQAVYPHLDGAKLNQSLGVILPALDTWLDSQTVAAGDYAGQTYRAMLNKVRSA